MNNEKETGVDRAWSMLLYTSLIGTCLVVLFTGFYLSGGVGVLLALAAVLIIFVLMAPEDEDRV